MEVSHLVLTRHPKPGMDKVQITIPPSAIPRIVTVQLVSTKSGEACRIGFDAENDIRIFRMELIDAKEQSAKENSITTGAQSRRTISNADRQNQQGNPGNLNREIPRSP